MKRDGYKIFSEGKIANVKLKNRLIRSATFEGISRTKKVTDEVLDSYRALAEGGVGMIMTGAMFATSLEKSSNNSRIIERTIEGVERLPEVVYKYASDCRIMAQINVVGKGPGAASDYPTPFPARRRRAASKEVIRQIEQCIVGVIGRMKAAGFDGVQLHAAHGYFLCSFLSLYMNRRTDEYGGSVENRTRIIREVIEKSRENVGDFPILVKMNCTDHVGEADIDGYAEVAEAIQRIGADAIELSSGIPECLARAEESLGFPPVPNPSAHKGIKTPEKQSYHLKYVEGMNLEIPVILTGGNRDIERLETIVQRGKADFIGLSRPLIREPDLPKRWLEGLGSNTTDCVSCNSCFYPILGPGEYSGLTCVHKEGKQLYREAQTWVDAWVENNRIK